MCDETKTALESLKKAIQNVELERNHFEEKLLIEIGKNLQNEQELAQFRAKEEEQCRPGLDADKKIITLEQSLNDEKMRAIKAKA